MGRRSHQKLTEDKKAVRAGMIRLCAVDLDFQLDLFDILFVEYLSTSVNTTPAELSIAERCGLHIHIYCLADYLMMDDL
jgi:hypothetical protein